MTTTTTKTRTLIVNADDFGLSPGVNAGIIEAHERGIVTSASLMVRWPAADDAADYARRSSTLGVGLHLDLGEWRFEQGEWRSVYEVVPEDDAAAVAGEINAQVEAFRALVGRDPDHLDSHQHAHTREPALLEARATAERLGIPLRRFSAAHYCGDFYGQTTEGRSMPQAVTVQSLLAILEEIAGADEDVVELCCHPARGDDLGTLNTMYRDERAIELAALCDPAVRQAIDRFGIKLCTFAACGGGRR